MTVELFLQRIKAECAGKPFKLHEHRECIYEILLTFIEREASIYDSSTRFYNFGIPIERIERAVFDPAKSVVDEVSALWQEETK